MYNPFTSGRERIVEMDPTKLVESIARDLHGAEPNDALRARYASIIAKFRASFGETAEIDFIVRAPGRINLIGEHIDYCGGSVLPMAVSQDVIIAGARNKITPQLHIVNVDDAKFDEKKIPLSSGEHVTIDRAAHHWTNYFLCGYKGAMEGISNHKDLIGLNLVVSGTVPAGGGMSSSSALVCAAALATMTAYQRPIDNKAVAEVAQRSERYIGTESGGMDQAISMLGEKGFAMRIDFNPLKGTRVQLPASVTFVVSNCLVESHKVLTADKMYNKRVVECRLASCLLAKLLGVEAWRTATPLLSLCGALKLTREQLHARADELMVADPYTVESIQTALGLESLDELVADIKMAPGVFKNNSDFHLKKRALHVFGEASRVFDFQAVCDRLAASAAAMADAGASAGSAEASAKAVQEIGALMNGSHQSCDALFDCSCDALNKLQKTCIEAGAIGSRLTGAGWGGCAISMVPADRVDAFIVHVAEHYYATLESKPADQSTYLFATAPSSGARAIDLRHRGGSGRLSQDCTIA